MIVTVSHVVTDFRLCKGRQFDCMAVHESSELHSNTDKQLVCKRWQTIPFVCLLITQNTCAWRDAQKCPAHMKLVFIPINGKIMHLGLTNGINHNGGRGQRKCVCQQLDSLTWNLTSSLVVLWPSYICISGLTFLTICTLPEFRSAGCAATPKGHYKGGANL